MSQQAATKGPDPIIVVAMAMSFMLASLTSEGSQSEYYTLPSWLQALQPVARPGAAGFLLVALIRYLMTGRRFSIRYLAGPAWVAWLINLLLLIKVLILGGELSFFTQATILALAQISLFVICVSGEQQSVGSRGQAAFLISNFESSVLLFAGMFGAANVTLLIVAPQAVSTWFGRFYGVTANPQHTMMIGVLCISACVLVLRRQASSWYGRAYALISLAFLAIIIFKTGSRTGFICGLLAFTVPFADLFKGRRLISTLYGSLLVVVVSLLLFGGQIWTSAFKAIDQQYIDGREDTRTQAWRRELNEFIDNWQFGVPLQDHGRLDFAETYWFSIASNGGVIGLFLASILLGLLLFTLRRLALACFQPRSPLRYRVYAGSLLAILIISTIESIFAGVIAAHTMLATGYLATGWNMAIAREFAGSRKWTLQR